MSEAPETLKLEPDYGAFGDINWSNPSRVPQDCIGEQYIRKDVLDAAVSAEREACAELCDVVTQDHVGDVIIGIGNEIRARAGVLDALVARDARVRAEALREAAEVAGMTRAPMQDTQHEAVGLLPIGDQIAKAILALIPADQEENLND